MYFLLRYIDKLKKNIIIARIAEELNARDHYRLTLHAVAQLYKKRHINTQWKIYKKIIVLSLLGVPIRSPFRSEYVLEEDRCREVPTFRFDLLFSLKFLRGYLGNGRLRQEPPCPPRMWHCSYPNNAAIQINI